MQTFEIARQKVVQLLGEVEDISESVIRGERVYGGKCFATVYVDLADNVVGRAPVILIDDPVAHIDDLNALSFLDYLRDLTVTSKKQVFFATADARIAALFTRKFSFLGDNFKRIKLLREEQTE